MYGDQTNPIHEVGTIKWSPQEEGKPEQEKPNAIGLRVEEIVEKATIEIKLGIEEKHESARRKIKQEESKVNELGFGKVEEKDTKKIEEGEVLAMML